MDFQVGFNIAIAVIGGLGGWMLNTMWGSVKDLQKADTDLADKVSRIEVLVAGQYVKRDDFDKTAAAIFVKLDKIYDLVQTKADK